MSVNCKHVDIETACEFLRGHDDYLILTHASPDGDTIGSGWALVMLLKKLGKRARVVCPDNIPKKFDYLTVPAEDFEPRTVVSVDVADPKLLGGLAGEYGGRVELCIDHHVSNVGYSRLLYLDEYAAATCECIYDLACALEIEVDKPLANALYTGIATDTGCFRFSNTTRKTHRIASELLSIGADSAEINDVMFETKSRARIEIERLVLDSMIFCCGGRGAVIVITQDMLLSSGCSEDDLEGITALPRTVEGVDIGVTVREKPERGVFRVSVRTRSSVDAREFCARFGGGGHIRAAGCELEGDVASVTETIISAINEYGEQK